MKKRKIQFCPICGRQNTSENKNGYCKKHYWQIQKFGKVLDTNPRTKYDPNEFRFKGNIVEFDTYKLPSNNVKDTYIINTEDYPIVSKYKWYTANNGYAMTRDNTGKKILLHRLIMEAKAGEQIDHINQNIKDNRRNNLRYCTNALNQANKKAYNTLKIKGVYQHKNGKYNAYIRRNNKQYHSQMYNTKEEAIFARYILEQLIYPEGLHQMENIPNLSEDTKKNIIDYLTLKYSKQ